MGADMDVPWTKLAEQVPQLVVFVFMVTMFLRHMSKSSAAIESSERRTAELIKELTEDAKDFQRDMTLKTTEAFAKNTGALERNSQALGVSTHVLDKYASVITK